MIKKPALTSKAAAGLGETGHFLCEATGVPNVTFAWMRSGGAYISPNARTTEKKYEVTEAMIDPLTFRSELLIFNVTAADYGSYDCVARNTEGTYCRSIVLSGSDSFKSERKREISHRSKTTFLSGSLEDWAVVTGMLNIVQSSWKTLNLLLLFSPFRPSRVIQNGNTGSEPASVYGRRKGPLPSMKRSYLLNQTILFGQREKRKPNEPDQVNRR